MQAIIFAFISYLGWGIGDIFGIIATRKIGGYSTTFWYLFFSLIFLVPFGIFFIPQLSNFSPMVFVLNVILGVIGLAGLVIFYEGLRIGNASLVGTIAASFTAVTVVLSIIFLGERITVFQAFAIVTIFLGIIISTLDFKEVKSKEVFKNKGVLLALVAMILWGIYWTFIKIPIREVGWFWPGFIAITVFPVLFPFMLIRKIKLENPLKKQALTSVVFNAILLTGAALMFNYAIGRGLTAIVAPIAGSYPTLFVILAFFIFKDKITKQQVLGIVTTLVGIVLLSIFSI